MSSHYYSGKTNRIPFLFWKWLVYWWTYETRKKGPSKNGLTLGESGCLKMVYHFLVRDYTLDFYSVAKFCTWKICLCECLFILFSDENMFVYVAHSSVAWGRSGLPSNVFFSFYCFYGISHGDEWGRGVIFL